MIKLKLVGDLIHYYEYQFEPIVGRRKVEKYPYPRLRKRRLRRSVERAEKAFRDLVYANVSISEPPALLTITYADCMGDLSLAYKHFRKFRIRLTKCFGVVRYVGVPEFQKRGAVHFHLLIWGLPSTSIPIGEWRIKIKKGKPTRVFYHLCPQDECICERGTRTIAKLWGLGFVDLVPTDGSTALAYYLSKYMKKAMSDSRLGGLRAYTSSKNIKRPVSYSTYREDKIVDLLMWKEDLENREPIIEKEFNTDWLGKGKYKLYKKASV